jgi:hypothetical protein
VVVGDELRASVVLTMVLKWAVVMVRKRKMYVDRIQLLRDRLNFEVALPFGEEMLLKEKLKMTQVQLEPIRAHIAREPP